MMIDISFYFVVQTMKLPTILYIQKQRLLCILKKTIIGIVFFTSHNLQKYQTNGQRFALQCPFDV